MSLLFLPTRILSSRQRVGIGIPSEHDLNGCDAHEAFVEFDFSGSAAFAAVVAPLLDHAVKFVGDMGFVNMPTTGAPTHMHKDAIRGNCA